MCVPQVLQAWRRIVFDGSTTFSLSAFAVTSTFSRGTTATIENMAPAGFQHCVQPQTWLCAVCALTATVTGFDAHLHASVPPAKSAAPCLTPLSTDGWIATAMIASG
jgi:hypothetical protein